MSRINIALCGIGGYAMLYTRYILDKNDPRIQPVGVVEPYPQSCPRLGDLEAAGIPVYATMEELYAAQKVDLTVIATPIQFHTPQILTALKNGSHVLCEKPLCADEKDIEILKNMSLLFGCSISDIINSNIKQILLGCNIYDDYLILNRHRLVLRLLKHLLDSFTLSKLLLCIGIKF